MRIVAFMIREKQFVRRFRHVDPVPSSSLHVMGKIREKQLTSVSNTEAPLSAAATQVFGLWGATMLLVGGVISIYGTLSGDMLSVPRVVFASARDGNLPRALGRVHPRYRTPSTAVIFYATVVGPFALSGTFKPLAVVASGSVLVLYAGVSLAVIQLRRRDGEPGPGELRLPFGPAIPLASCGIGGVVAVADDRVGNARASGADRCRRLAVRGAQRRVFPDRCANGAYRLLKQGRRGGSLESDPSRC